MAGAQKKARREGRLIVFIDESGLSERPTRVRTWAPKGQTPIIQFHFNWTHISVIAGLTRTNCMFRLHEGSIKKEQHVEFLKALRAHLKRPLLIIWDGLKAHRSKLVREYLDSTEGEVQMAFLPPYSPDLAPCYFFLFPNMKTWLGGKKFSSNEEVIAETEAYFAEFNKSYFLEGLKKWQKRWEKCIDLKGDYVEK